MNRAFGNWAMRLRGIWPGFDLNGFIVPNTFGLMAGLKSLKEFPAKGPISDISSYGKMLLSDSRSTSWTFFAGTTRDVVMEAPGELAVAVRDETVKSGFSFRLSRRRFNDHPVHRSSQNVG